jgi:hypothetical protein
MNYRRITGLFGAAGGLVVGTEIAQAQEELGDSIANTVSGAVSSIATKSGSGGTVSGGGSAEHSEVNLGEKQGLAIADASGGNNNLSFVS